LQGVEKKNRRRSGGGGFGVNGGTKGKRCETDWGAVTRERQKGGICPNFQKGKTKKSPGTGEVGVEGPPHGCTKI